MQAMSKRQLEHIRAQLEQAFDQQKMQDAISLSRIFDDAQCSKDRQEARAQAAS